jgi:hypothetical protein
MFKINPFSLVEVRWRFQPFWESLTPHSTLQVQAASCGNRVRLRKTVRLSTARRAHHI